MFFVIVPFSWCSRCFFRFSLIVCSRTLVFRNECYVRRSRVSHLFHLMLGSLRPRQGRNLLLLRAPLCRLTSRRIQCIRWRGSFDWRLVRAARYLGRVRKENGFFGESKKFDIEILGKNESGGGSAMCRFFWPGSGDALISSATAGHVHFLLAYRRGVHLKITFSLHAPYNFSLEMANSLYLFQFAINLALFESYLKILFQHNLSTHAVHYVFPFLSGNLLLLKDARVKICWIVKNGLAEDPRMHIAC